MSEKIFKVNILVRGYVGVGKTKFCSTFSNCEENSFINSAGGGSGGGGGKTIGLLKSINNNGRAFNKSITFGGNGTNDTYCKLVNISTIWNLFNNQIKEIIQSNEDDLPIDETSKIQICLIDSSGFDVQCSNLPDSMYRDLDSILFLVSFDPNDMTTYNDSTKWCIKAYNNFWIRNQYNKTKKIIVELVGTKCDLIFNDKSFQTFKNQNNNNNLTVRKNLEKCYKISEYLDYDDEKLVFFYLSMCKNNTLRDFSTRCAELKTAIILETEIDEREEEKEEQKEKEEKKEDIKNYFRLVSSETQCNVNIVIYKIAVKVIENYLLDYKKSKSRLNEPRHDVVKFNNDYVCKPTGNNLNSLLLRNRRDKVYVVGESTKSKYHTSHHRQFNNNRSSQIQKNAVEYETISRFRGNLYDDNQYDCDDNYNYDDGDDDNKEEEDCCY